MSFHCKGCMDRTPWCHAECETYKRDKIKHSEMKKRQRSDAMINQTIIGIVVNAQAKRSKKGR